MSICPADNRPCDYSPCPRLGMCAPFSAKPYQPQNTRPREDALQAEVERLREALTEIKKLKPEPIGNSGFQTGPVLLIRRAREIAAAALKGAPHE